jgi:hypothetical protein
VLVAAKAVLVEEANRLAAELELVVGKAHALRDDLLALPGVTAARMMEHMIDGVSCD